MRLSEHDLQAIKLVFKQCFKEGDHIWLFGSRANPQQKGGDIDLYIETSETDYQKSLQNKLNFLTFLQNKIGEQKIDVVIKMPNTKELPIYQEARETGIQLI